MHCNFAVVLYILFACACLDSLCIQDLYLLQGENKLCLVYAFILCKCNWRAPLLLEEKTKLMLMLPLLQYIYESGR